MAEQKNIKECKKLIKTLENKTYFPAVLSVYNEKLCSISQTLVDSGMNETEARKKSYITILSSLHDIMREAESRVETIINNRIAEGKIQNADQARKSVAGNAFQQLIAYSIAKNIVEKNIDKNIVVTMSTKLLKEYAIIKVGEDEQKPDSDVLVYSLDDTSPIINYSCKTSCRERAGQTYKWKLLSDLATCNCDHIEDNENCPVKKYRLDYQPRRKIYCCFITADFYNELNNPQIAAMFNFFDYSYIAKETSPSTRIKTLSNIINDINNIF